MNAVANVRGASKVKVLPDIAQLMELFRTTFAACDSIVNSLLMMMPGSQAFCSSMLVWCI